MKASKNIMLLIAVFTILLPSIYADCSTMTWDGGDGTINSPYGIMNCSQLENVGQEIDCLDKNFVLTQDIDCSVIPNIQMIGNNLDNLNFSGVFDGKGYTIHDMTLNRSASNVLFGLFSVIDHSGIVRNLNFANSTIGGLHKMGTLVGLNHGLISRVTIVDGIVSTRGQYNAGLAHENRGIIEKSSFIGRVRATQGAISAGLVLYNYGEGIIRYCYAGGYVHEPNMNSGLVGYNYGGLVHDSYSDAFLNCTQTCNSMGGIVAWNRYDAVVNRTYSSGTIMGYGTGNNCKGGIVGSSSGYSYIDNSFATGYIDGNGSGTEKGGISGGVLGSITYVFNSRWQNNLNICCGTYPGTTTYCTDCTKASNYTDFINTTTYGPLDEWDFDTVWKMQEDGYPILRWQIAGGIPTWTYSGSDAKPSVPNAPASTDFSTVPDITNVTNLTLATEHGAIQFPIDYGVNAEDQDYDNNIIFGDCFVSVNSSGLDFTFNATAYLMMNNSDGHCGENIIFASDNFHTSADDIRAEQKLCTTCDEIIKTNDFITKFRVAGFSSYAIGANSRLDIYDEYENSFASVDTSIGFYANYTNLTSGNHIPGAACMIRFDTDPTEFAMTDNGNYYIYTLVGGYATEGTYNFHVECSATGFNTLNTTDTIQVGPPSVIPEFNAITLLIALVLIAAVVLISRRR